ncbi:hypothetical protein MRB53_035096 [Persea americana]|uniref:Uncharacterized protein n=1 Tax=Persea americana TaxID=3435 RepID=A0ACC2K3S4_PERAE|nr:hypothetical protein MRB53_035096 [Persea americana]
MNDGAQKEMMIISSFGGAEDVSVGVSSCFVASGSPRIDPRIDKDRVLLLLFHRDRSLDNEGSILDASAQKTMRTNSSSSAGKASKSQCWPRNDPFLLQKASTNFH